MFRIYALLIVWIGGLFFSSPNYEKDSGISFLAVEIGLTSSRKPPFNLAVLSIPPCFLWHFCFTSSFSDLSISAHLFASLFFPSTFMLFNIHILPSISSLFPPVLFSAVTFTLLIWSSWLASLSIHSTLHFAHAYCPASGPHFPPPHPPPPPLHLNLSPPLLFMGICWWGKPR